MNIYLVRHGEAAANWQDSEDPGLSKLGQQQAEHCAAQIAADLGTETRLISSPLLRAWETAAPLGVAMQKPVAMDEAFREIIAPVPRKVRQNWLYSIASQRWEQQHEMVQEWRQQVLDALHEIREPTVVFTHFMVLNAIIGALTEAGKIVCFMPDNASVTLLRRLRGGLELVELGRELETDVN